MNEIYGWINEEKKRQNDNIELIASENYPSYDVRMAQASCLTSKYAEGYPETSYAKTGYGNHGRYYGGCYNIDRIEDLCRLEWQKAFKTNYHVNVQPHSGSHANMAAYAAVLKPGDTILTMSLDQGGHLSHGSPVNFSGKLYNVVHYGVDENGYIDYNDLRHKISLYAPDLIVAGASAYPREIDFKEFKECIDEIVRVDQIPHPVYFMVDMAHVAGLVAAECHCSPFPYADIVTSTSQKTMRGPRGGIIFCRRDLATKIDSSVFPGTSGGPLEHVIAAKAIAAREAQTEEFKEYIQAVIKNCGVMESVFKKNGIPLVTNGTDNHLLLLDLSKYHFSGKVLQKELDRYGITGNKNCIPNDKLSPKETSGFRIGTAAMTTRGAGRSTFMCIALMITYMIKALEAKTNGDKDKEKEYKMEFFHSMYDYNKMIQPHLKKVEDIGKTTEAVEFWKSQL